MGRITEILHYANTPPNEMLHNWHLFTRIDYKDLTNSITKKKYKLYENKKLCFFEGFVIEYNTTESLRVQKNKVLLGRTKGIMTEEEFRKKNNL